MPLWKELILSSHGWVSQTISELCRSKCRHCIKNQGESQRAKRQAKWAKTTSTHSCLNFPCASILHSRVTSQPKLCLYWIGCNHVFMQNVTSLFQIVSRNFTALHVIGGGWQVGHPLSREGCLAACPHTVHNCNNSVMSQVSSLYFWPTEISWPLFRGVCFSSQTPGGFTLFQPSQSSWILILDPHETLLPTAIILLLSWAVGGDSGFRDKIFSANKPDTASHRS